MITCVMPSTFLYEELIIQTCTYYSGLFELFDDGDDLGIWMYSSVRMFICFAGEIQNASFETISLYLVPSCKNATSAQILLCEVHAHLA